MWSGEVKTQPYMHAIFEGHLAMVLSTLVSLAPTGPPQSFTVTPRARNMTFSWSPPASNLQHGMITGYFLSCVPANGGNSISMQYTASGTFTLGGFTPATSYNCSIFASNSQGSGPATYMIVTTQDDSKHHGARLVCWYLSVFSALLSSNVVPAAAEWNWSESLSGVGSKCNFLKIELLS